MTSNLTSGTALSTGTLSISPADGSTVRLASIIAVTVTVTLASGDLPPNAYATLEVTDGGTLTTNPRQPFVKDANSGQTVTASAVFYVGVDPDAQRVAVTAGTDNFLLQADPISVSYQPTLTAATIQYFDPNPIWRPTAPDSNQLPTNENYTIHYSATVTDDDDEPIEGYVIEWGQVWDIDVFGDMRAFASQDANQPLIPDRTPLHKDGVVRTTTNTDGVADLYLVTTKSQVYFALNVFGRIDDPVQLERVVVFSEKIDAMLTAPQVPLIIHNDVADLDSVDGPSVPITIIASDPEWSIKDPTQVLLFVNTLVSNKIVTFLDASDLPQNVISDVSKIHFFTDHGPHANEINNAYYVRAIQGGPIGRSPAWQHRAKGDNHGNEPPNVDRLLPAPQVLYAPAYINVRTVQGDLYLEIPVVESHAWKPEQYDVITATIYMNAWESGAHMVNPQTKTGSLSITYPLLEDPSTLNGAIDLAFPYDCVIGFDSRPSTPPRGGDFFAEYYVVKHDDIHNRRIYSYLYYNHIDTAAPGYVDDTPPSKMP